jgi:hypothetical protein
MGQQVSEWKNNTSGQVGVVKFDDEGKRRALAVSPGGLVLLTERERVATANAPTKDDDNPFANGSLVCITAEAQLSNRRPIGDPSSPAPPVEPPAPQPAVEPEAAAEPVSAPSTASDAPAPTEVPDTAGEPDTAEEAAQRAIEADTRETGAATEPQGKPPQGQRAPKEETGTPVPTPPTPRK